MPCSVAVEVTDAGPVVAKRATGADVSRLRAAGERLLAAAHPGVVEVVDSHGSDEAWVLRLVHAGRAVDTLGPLAPAEVAALVAAVAATLADLHGAGIVHGRLTPAHVLLGAHGRPVLCGFGDVPTPGASPAADVAALGSLIVTLLGGEDDGDPVPERRWSRRRSSAAWARRTLLLLADHACAEPPTRRPSARRLAAAISEAFPGAVADRTSVAATHADPAAPADPLDALRASADTPAGRAPVLAVVCAAAGALLLGAAGIRLAHDDAGRPAPPVRVGPAPTALPPTTTHISPVTAHVDGRTVRFGSQRYEVGDPGDLVVLGDWDCDGAPTPAVLRPATGEVFVFPTWATEGDLVVHALVTVGGAVDLEVEDAGSGCAALTARLDGGRRVEIPEAVRT